MGYVKASVAAREAEHPRPSGKPPTVRNGKDGRMQAGTAKLDSLTVTRQGPRLEAGCSFQVLDFPIRRNHNWLKSLSFFFDRGVNNQTATVESMRETVRSTNFD